MLAEWLGIYLTIVDGPSSDQSAVLKASFNPFPSLLHYSGVGSGERPRCPWGPPGPVPRLGMSWYRSYVGPIVRRLVVSTFHPRSSGPEVLREQLRETSRRHTVEPSERARCATTTTDRTAATAPRTCPRTAPMILGRGSHDPTLFMIQLCTSVSSPTPRRWVLASHFEPRCGTGPRALRASP